MQLSSEQLVQLDEYGWFGSDLSQLWGETAYEAATCGFDGRGDFNSSDFHNYVRYTLATMPEFAPSPTFCRRIALWWNMYRPHTSEEAENVHHEDLVDLAASGLLARFDEIEFTEQEMRRILNWLSDGAKGGSEWAHLDAVLNHPSVTTEHLDRFWEESKKKDRMLLEVFPYLAAHPRSSHRLLGAIQDLVSKQMKVREDQMSEWRWRFCYELAAKHLASRRELPFWNRLKFSKWKDSNIQFSDYYYGGVEPLQQDIMTLPANPTSDELKLAAERWWFAFHPDQEEYKQASLVGLSYGVGSDGIPNAVALTLALNWWAAVVAGTEGELLSTQRPVWLLPYIDGAIRWAYEVEQGALKDVPFEWVAETLGLRNPPTPEWNVLSPDWIQGAITRG